MPDKEIFQDIYKLFNSAKKSPKLAKRYIQLAKKMAMKNTIKLPKELKKKFCSKCFSLFNAKNSKVRIKNNFKTIKCLECNSYKRIKIC